MLSPLRYPGGKAKLFDYFVRVISANELFAANYCEPYAGGAGLALRLLAGGFVRRITLNDIDEGIYAFWRSILDRPDDFCRLVRDTEISIDEWHRQKSVWSRKSDSDLLDLGFAAYYLNRTNRSGIIEGAGPIGGYAQSGAWKLDVRFNRQQQISQISQIAALADRIDVQNLDALQFTADRFGEPDSFCYLDPPYYVKGSKLYRNFYADDDHRHIRDMLLINRDKRWVVSYDDVSAIRSIYAPLLPTTYSLSYSAGEKNLGREVIYFSDTVVQPAYPGFEQIAA